VSASKLSFGINTYEVCLLSVSLSLIGQSVLVDTSPYPFLHCILNRSSSMYDTDRQPLANAPTTNRIVLRSNNRLGAVYSALHSFWSARHAAVNVRPQTTQTRRDAYSVIFFNDTVSTSVTNDFTSSPDQLLDAVLLYSADGGTDFTMALQSAQTIMEQYFNPERYGWDACTCSITHFMERTPVIIFLSDGECAIEDQTVHDLCRSAVHLGYVLLRLLRCSSLKKGPQ
jgi:hypothetical protein